VTQGLEDTVGTGSGALTVGAGTGVEGAGASTVGAGTGVVTLEEGGCIEVSVRGVAGMSVCDDCDDDELDGCVAVDGTGVELALGIGNATAAGVVTVGLGAEDDGGDVTGDLSGDGDGANDGDGVASGFEVDEM